MKRSRKGLRRRYGHAARGTSGARATRGGPAHIIGAWITHYGDTGQVKAYVRWQNSRGEETTTEGSPNNLHMQSLLDRAIRSGVQIQHNTSGAIWDPAILKPGEKYRVVKPSESTPARFR